MHRLHFEALVALINKGLKISAVIIDMPTYVGLKPYTKGATFSLFFTVIIDMPTYVGLKLSVSLTALIIAGSFTS